MLDLEAAQRIALQGNPGLGAAQARIEQAKARVEQAMAANLPSVDASGSMGIARYSDTNFAAVSLSQASADQTYENSSIGLQASWLLFDGYAKKFRVEQAEYGEESSVAGRLNSQRLLVAAVAEAFFNAQLALNSVEISASDRKFYEKQLSDAKHRFEAGSGSWGDVLNIKVQLNSAKTSTIVGKREYETAKYALAALLGFANSTLPNTLQLVTLDRDSDPAVDDLTDKADALIKEGLRTRPDLEKLTLQIKAAEAAVGQAEAQYWPKVRLNGQVSGNNQGDLVPGGDDVGASIALNVSWNLYSGGAVKAAATEARQAKREAAYGYADLRNSIATEIQKGVVLLVAAREQVRLQRESVGLVEENRKLAKSEYEAGAASLVRLNEAQRDLTATYGRLAQALVGCQQARHRLLAAVGRNLAPFTDLLEAEIAEPKQVK